MIEKNRQLGVLKKHWHMYLFIYLFIYLLGNNSFHVLAAYFFFISHHSFSDYHADLSLKKSSEAQIQF